MSSTAHSTVDAIQARDADLARLDRLVGSWDVTGGAAGRVTYRWLEGGYFLAQDVELVHDGGRTVGLEVIGREREFGAEQPSDDIVSRYYDSEGNTFDYVYDLEGDVLTIWGGERGSPAFYRGTFSDGGNALLGRWEWPGGGYESIARRVE